MQLAIAPKLETTGTGSPSPTATARFDAIYTLYTAENAGTLPR